MKNITISKAQRVILKHGIIVIIVGLLGGFCLAWNVAGYIVFPPIPFTIDIDIPGTTAAWRAVHTGNIMNGLMALILGGLFYVCDLSKTAQKRLSWSILYVIWGNCVFYIASVFAPNHGLALGDNAAGKGNLAGIIAYIPAISAAYLLIVVLFILLKKLKKAED